VTIKISRRVSHIDLQMSHILIFPDIWSPNPTVTFHGHLAPCDFLPWGYLKSKVYVNKPQTLADLRNSIRSDIVSITMEMLEKVMTNFGECLQECIIIHRHHLMDILFHT
jgi:hypothetical protein